MLAAGHRRPDDAANQQQDEEDGHKDHHRRIVYGNQTEEGAVMLVYLSNARKSYGGSKDPGSHPNLQKPLGHSHLENSFQGGSISNPNTLTLTLSP